ncbi:MAG TPA: hemerythrin domain-containing protein [Polyangiaceae bacterium]|nr:hemerythrin domain-containing protein [Polyangiaceae bacterium]
MESSVDAYVAHHEGLVRVHRALLASFALLARPGKTELDAWIPQLLQGCQFLESHHHAESSVLFAGLRRFGRLRSSDAAFLDSADDEHTQLEILRRRLLNEARAAHPRASAIQSWNAELRVVLTRHTAGEEAGLAAERLRDMISLQGLHAIQRELEALRKVPRR